MKTQTNVLNVMENYGFVAGSYEIQHAHGFQFFLDVGVTPGPWLGLGLNTTLYVAGWVPDDYLEKRCKPQK